MPRTKFVDFNWPKLITKRSLDRVKWRKLSRCKDRLANSKVKSVCLILEKYLDKHKHSLFTRQHRDAKGKKTFDLQGSWKIGHGSTQVGHKQHVGKKRFFEMHNFKDTGVHLRPVETQEITPKSLRFRKLKCYLLAKTILQKIDPTFASGPFIVQFAMMSSPDHKVERHVDRDDITHQYVLSLGAFKNARFVIEEPEAPNPLRFDTRHKMLRVDGRNPHWVENDGFEGERFTVIFYKGYDFNFKEPAPRQAPEVVFEF